MLNAVAGGRRVFEIMDEKPTVLDAPNAQPFEFKGGSVEFGNVDFSYVTGRKILKHNTFEAQARRDDRHLRANRRGQEHDHQHPDALLRHRLRADPDRRAEPDDLTTQESLRQQIGAVLQEAFLFTDTVMNNLKYAREGATDEECIAAAKEANAHEFIMNLPQGYDTVMTERGANLSQGQRQMMTIARAMVAQSQDPDPGRGHQQRGHAHREADPGRACSA